MRVCTGPGPHDDGFLHRLDDVLLCAACWGREMSYRLHHNLDHAQKLPVLPWPRTAIPERALGGETYDRIGADYGMSKQRVLQVLLDAGVSVRQARTAALVDKAIAGPLTPAERGRLRRAGIPPQRLRLERDRERRAREWLALECARLYRAGFSLAEVAGATGLTVDAVVNRLDATGVTRRSRGRRKGA